MKPALLPKDVDRNNTSFRSPLFWLLSVYMHRLGSSSRLPTLAPARSILMPHCCTSRPWQQGRVSRNTSSNLLRCALRCRHYKQEKRWNIWGTMLMVFYTLAFIFYMWVRITKTLDLGQYLGYGIFVLIVEIMGATSTISYGINLIWSPVNLSLAEDPANPGLPKVGFQWCPSWITAA